MGIQGLMNIKKAIGSLNPKHVRDLSEKTVRVALYAASPDSYRAIEEFLLQGLGPARRRDSAASITRGPDPSQALHYDLAIYDESVLAPARAFVFERINPQRVVQSILASRDDLGVPLARSFMPFRKPYIDIVISRTARENTLFSLATALPDIIPSLIELPWAIAEFASDSAFLTMNQIRMAFLIAGASDRAVGYMEQKSEIATVIGSAFGWRAIARQLIGKIPFGGGLLPKAGIAYAGTKVLGLSLEHFYGIGYLHTRAERTEMYSEAFDQGKRVAGQILSHLRPDLAKKFADRASAASAKTLHNVGFQRVRQ